MSVGARGAAAERCQLPGQAKPEQPGILHPALRQTGQQQPVRHLEKGEGGDQAVVPWGDPRGHRGPGSGVVGETTGSQYVTGQPTGVPTACSMSTTPEETGAAGSVTSAPAAPSGNRQTRTRS